MNHKLLTELLDTVLNIQSRMFVFDCHRKEMVIDSFNRQLLQVAQRSN